MFCPCAIQRRIHGSLNRCLSKLARSRRKEVNYIEFLAVFTQIFLEILAKQSKTVKNACIFTIEYLTLFLWQSEYRKLGSSNQRKYKKDRHATMLWIESDP